MVCPQQVHHCPWASWMHLRGEGGHVCFCSQLYSEELKGLALNGRFSLNICWKEGGEGWRGKKPQSICAYQSLVDKAKTTWSSSRQSPFSCWAHLDYLSQPPHSRVTENERGCTLMRHRVPPGLSLKNFPQSLCLSPSLPSNSCRPATKGALKDPEALG